MYEEYSTMIQHKDYYGCEKPTGCKPPDLPIKHSLTHWGWDKMAASLADDIFKCISLHENFWILNKISLKYVTWGQIDNMAALVEIMAWRWTGAKPLSEPMMVYCIDAYVQHSASMS